MAEISTLKNTSGKELYGLSERCHQGNLSNDLIDAGEDYHLLYQLPTGGGKTVIFSEIVRRYLETIKKSFSINAQN